MKFALLVLLVTALAVPSIAAAATPQGKLTGAGAAGGGVFGIVDPVIDGGDMFVGAGNDNSGNCNGDSGTVAVGVNTNVVCAHYVASSGCCNTGSPKMRLAFLDASGFYLVAAITDNGPVNPTTGLSPDTFMLGAIPTLAEATAWVNRGRIGSAAAGASWSLLAISSGDYTVTAAQ